MNYPRVLVISNNSFSLTNSNGRTLGSLFYGWPKDKLAQFCITSDGPDRAVCNNYFCASDRSVLKSTLLFRGVKRDSLVDFDNTKANAKRIKRTPIKSIIRHIIWSLRIWRKGDFNRWVASFSPEIVIIQSGDTAFTHDLARYLSIHFNAKLVFFNTEGIYFLKKNYLYKGFCDGLFFPIYHRLYRKSYKKAMDNASYAFYLNKLIQDDNDACFEVPNSVIYTTSRISQTDFTFNNSAPVISYFGNFGYDRSKVLAEVAQVIKDMGLDLSIDVYGKGFPEIEVFLKQCDGVSFHGFVSYATINEIIQKSDILLHVESQEEKHAESLKYGFSTKIADCLSSGRPFLLYSSRNIACAQYIIENDCAWFADSKESLISAINSIIHDKFNRDRIIGNAIAVSKNNHNLEKNSNKFQKSLLSL